MLDTSAQSRAHPRACGEHRAAQVRKTTWPGSSPRMRGTRTQIIVKHTADRLIPAHAGNTWDTIFECAWAGAHPRACGEHMLSTKPRPTMTGSSPRMRGTHCFWGKEKTPRGLIPAHAGNTGRTPPGCSWGWAHPRACGEHCGARSTSLVAAGSSPRMRGTPLTQQVNASPPRLIPAHAGNT